jgi:hypothetical protein
LECRHRDITIRQTDECGAVYRRCGESGYSEGWLAKSSYAKGRTAAFE